MSYVLMFSQLSTKPSIGQLAAQLPSNHPSSPAFHLYPSTEHPLLNLPNPSFKYVTIQGCGRPARSDNQKVRFPNPPQSSQSSVESKSISPAIKNLWFSVISVRNNNRPQSKNNHQVSPPFRRKLDFFYQFIVQNVKKYHLIC